MAFAVSHVALLAVTSEPCDWTPEARASATRAVLQSLTAKGYAVREGVQKLFATSAFGANPGNPYLVYQELGHVGPLPAFKLDDKRSAILNIVCTPPDVSYFGWRSYLFSEPFPVFASLGDTLNHLVINTTGGRSDVHSRTAAIVTTADATVYAHVRTALAGTGLANATNLDSYAVRQLPHPELSRFVVLHRASIWADPSAKAAYANASNPIFLVTPPREQPASPLPLLPLRKRGTGHREGQIPGLTTNLASLHVAVVRDLAARHNASLIAQLTLQPIGLDGARCIRERTACWGNNNDANYLKLRPPVSLESEEVAYVVGSNCVSNGKCTYTNIGLYAAPDRATNISADHRRFNGSAAAFLPSLPPEEAVRLFAYAVARDCSPYAPYCVELPRSQAPRDWWLIYRTYLEPATKTGPAVEELIMPRVLRFRVRRRGAGPESIRGRSDAE